MPSGKLNPPQGKLNLPQGKFNRPSGKFNPPQGKLNLLQGKLSLLRGRFNPPSARTDFFFPVCHSGRLVRLWRGNRTANVVSPPSEITSASPPCDRATSRTTNSPSPRPSRAW
jgi:hypothetical protein